MKEIYNPYERDLQLLLKRPVTPGKETYNPH